MACNDAMAVLFAARPPLASQARCGTAEPLVHGTGGQHIMLSYEWSMQDRIKRIRASLGRRRYKVWLDVEQMRGSTMDSMSDAVDHATAICYGLSEAYKESVNCR